MREISFDTETTGLEPLQGHRLVELGCVEMIDRVPTGNNYHIYLNPERDIPIEAQQVHGLSAEFLQDKPLFADIVDEFLEFVGDSTLVIHNAQFDMKFLNAELTWARKRELPNSQVLCTLKAARKKFPGSPASLDALCKRFNIDNSARTKHGALLDAELLAEVYMELMGGSQVALELSNQSNTRNDTANIKREVKAVRPHAPSQQELFDHEEFLSQIKDPLWKKQA